MQVLLYESTDCTGPEMEVEPRPGGSLLGEWSPEAQADIPVGQFGERSISARLLLEHYEPGSPGCLFDSVRLYRSGTASVVEVPATGTPGLVFLILFVTAAGVVLLRR